MNYRKPPTQQQAQKPATRESVQNMSVRDMRAFLRIVVLLVAIIMLHTYLITERVFAEVTHSVDLTLTGNTGYISDEVRQRDDEADNWLLSGSGLLKYTLSGKGENVRGQARLEILGDSRGGNVLEVSRAFIRSKVPLGANYSMQLEMGKNSISWGEGSYYNAGDVIFGADPKDANLGSNAEYRDYAHWQLRTFFPLGAFSYIEAVIGLPDQEYHIATRDSVTTSDTRTTSDSTHTSVLVAPITDITEAGSGARIHLELLSDSSVSPQLELGAYSRFVNQTVDPYISFALPLAVRLYVASGMQIDYDDDAGELSTQVDDELGVSGGFLYTRGFGRGGTLSLGGEVLYKGDVTKLQLNTSWGFNRVFAVVLRGDATLENNIYSVVLGPQLTPEAGYTLSVLSITTVDTDDDADKNFVYTGASIVMQYKY